MLFSLTEVVVEKLHLGYNFALLFLLKIVYFHMKWHLKCKQLHVWTCYLKIIEECVVI